MKKQLEEVSQQNQRLTSELKTVANDNTKLKQICEFFVKENVEVKKRFQNVLTSSIYKS